MLLWSFLTGKQSVNFMFLSHNEAGKWYWQRCTLCLSWTFGTDFRAMKGEVENCPDPGCTALVRSILNSIKVYSTPSLEGFFDKWLCDTSPPPSYPQERGTILPSDIALSCSHNVWCIWYNTVNGLHASSFFSLLLVSGYGKTDSLWIVWCIFPVREVKLSIQSLDSGKELTLPYL